MSTKSTISYSDDYHLYEEIGDRHNVYLRLDSGDWAASLTTATVDWNDGDHSRPVLALKINVDMWRQITSDWAESHWGKNINHDHKEPEWNIDNSWLKMVKDRAKENKSITPLEVKKDE